MTSPSFDQIADTIEDRGHKVFRGGPHDLNVGGIRSEDTGANSFNDFNFIFWWDQGNYSGLIVPSTTDPGTYWRDQPPNKKGTAIMLPGQYRGAYSIGKHQGKYECLKQKKPIDFFRVQDGVDWVRLYDIMLYEDEVNGVEKETSVIGANIHRASATRTSTQVDKWSAACQVIASPHHYDAFMALARGQVALGGGSSFSYTLLLEDQLISTGE